MAKDDTSIVTAGRMRTIEYAVRTDGSMPARVFLDSLHVRDRQHLMGRFQHLADGGEQVMNNQAVFKKERPPFFAFKRRSKHSPRGGEGMIRIPCFRIGNRWILTHGFWKEPQSEWAERHFAEANQIHSEVMAREQQATRKENP